MEKPQDPQNILDSVSGILYDILPAALTAEIESSINGIEKFEVTSGKFKIEGTTIIFTALKISTLLEFPNGDKVTESIIFDGKVSLDDLLRLAAKFVFAIAFLIVIMLTPIDELAGILTTAWTVLKPLFEKA